MAIAPRVVIAVRRPLYEVLLAEHATHGQAAFFLQQRGQDITPLQRQADHQAAAIGLAVDRLPAGWRWTLVERAEFDRFSFEPTDLVVAIGQDGLVPNLSKYLDEQPVFGIDPNPGPSPQVMAVHRPDDIERFFILAAAGGDLPAEPRVMAEATLDDGLGLTALNDLFIGHRSHQSARYAIRFDDDQEEQSSSGVLVSTGTGATGWLSSVRRVYAHSVPAPGPTDPNLVFFVREPWVSARTGCRIDAGTVAADTVLEIVSRMEQGGVLFGDGIETDFLPFAWGQRATIRVSERRLRLVRLRDSQAVPRRQAA